MCGSSILRCAAVERGKEENYWTPEIKYALIVTVIILYSG